MPNPQKAKGSAFERLVCDYLAQAFPCERIPAGATLDRGDLWTEAAAIQCKNHRTLSLGSWLTQTIEQQRNAGKRLHALIVKRKGTTDPSQQLVVMSLDQFRSLLSQLPP
jgi:hypothetical protein